MIGNIMVFGWFVLVVFTVIGLVIYKNYKNRTLETVLALSYCAIPLWIIVTLFLCFLGV